MSPMLLLVLGLLAAGDEVGSNLSTQYRQNAERFSRLKVEATWTQEFPEQLRESSQNEISFVLRTQEEIEKQELPPPIIGQLKKQAAQEKISLEEARKRFWKRSIEAKIDTFKALAEAAGSSYSESRGYIFTPDLQEIHLPIGKDNPHKRGALARGIESFNGGDWTRIQRSTTPDARWTALEPYPFEGTTAGNAWTVAMLQHDGILPPFVDPVQIKDGYLLQLAPLEKGGPGLTSVGTIESSGSSATLLFHALTKYTFWLAAVPDSRGAIPLWTSFWAFGPKTRANDMTEASYRELADHVARLRTNTSTVPLKLAQAQEIVYFEKLQEVAGAGWYPLSIRRHVLGPLRPKDAPDVDAELPTGWMTVETLKIESVQANDAVEGPAVLELPPGTSVTNLDNSR